MLVTRLIVTYCNVWEKAPRVSQHAAPHVEWARSFNTAHSPLHTGRESREEAGTDKLEGEDVRDI